jgi:hypothetical protein
MMTTSSDKLTKNNINTNSDNNEQPSKQKKANTEDAVAVEAVEEEDEEDEEEFIDTYVVVTETYPTTYGANRGTTYDRGLMIALTKFEVTQDFDTHQEALEHGIKLRDASCWFTDYEYREGIDNDNNPPWDSAQMKNYDNDQEVRIQIMATMDYDDWAYENQLHLEHKLREQKREQKIEERM